MALKSIFSSFLELCVSVGYFWSNTPFTEWKALAFLTELCAFVLCGKYSVSLCALVCCISLIRAYKTWGKKVPEHIWMCAPSSPPAVSYTKSGFTLLETSKLGFSLWWHRTALTQLLMCFEPDWKSAIHLYFVIFSCNLEKTKEDSLRVGISLERQ